MAFQNAKKALTSSPVLMHYDPALPVSLATDASAYGVGAVISHTLPDGAERPIAFASRTLIFSESHYAQIEKEALSIVFEVKRFHTYLYGRQFTLLTDHKPLCTIFGPKKVLPLAFNVGLFCCQCTAMTFVTSLPKSMQMQTVTIATSHQGRRDGKCSGLPAGSDRQLTCNSPPDPAHHRTGPCAQQGAAIHSSIVAC